MASALVMSGTDAFLFGIVLLIFTYSIAFGFVFDLPPEIRRTVPSWMRVEGIQELKNTLLSVILVYMVVDFATDWAAAEDPLPWSAILAKPVAIFAGSEPEAGHPRDADHDGVADDHRAERCREAHIEAVSSSQ